MAPRSALPSGKAGPTSELVFVHAATISVKRRGTMPRGSVGGPIRALSQIAPKRGNCEAFRTRFSRRGGVS